MFQPLIPRTLIKNLDDSLQAQFAKSNPHHLRNNKPPKIIQKHPTLRFFWGKIWGVLGGCIPFPPFFFWGGKNGQIKGETSPLDLSPPWEPPTKPAESKTNPGSLQEVGWRLRGWNHQITHEFLVRRKIYSRKYDQRWVM